jgi:Cyanate lyase C-terminal domain
MQVYDMPLKAVIHEKFGDGIMSAIDFTMHVEREADPKGDRMRITISGKFLPYNGCSLSGVKEMHLQPVDIKRLFALKSVSS